MDAHIEAEKDYISGMKYKDIAEKYGVSLNTVKSWKQRYGWQKGMHTKSKKVCTQKHEKKGQEYDGTQDTICNEELTEKEQYFCVFYAKSFNATQSYIKAYGSSYTVANVEGCKLLVKPSIKNEIARLKEIKRQQIMCGEEDIVERHMKIAFADIGDYLEFGTKMVDVMGPFGPIQVKNPKTGKKETIQKEINFVRLNPSEYTDTSIIQEVKQRKDGVSIKLADKQKSLDFLEKYFTLNPMDKHKIEYDKKLLEMKKVDKPEDYAEKNIQALSEILLNTRENRRLEDFERALEQEVQDESDSTTE